MCEPWLNDPEAFCDYVGDAPSPQHTLDRIDNNGNYEPGNLRWATRREQNNNRRNNHPIMFNGRTLNVAQWDEHLGFPSGTVAARLGRG